MSLKLNANHHLVVMWLLQISVYVSFPTWASNTIELHGFLAQGVVQNKDSSFVNDDDDFSFDLTEVGLNLSYQVSNSVRIAGQAVYLNGGNRFDEGFRVDYLLFDWNFYNDEHWQNHFYVGRIKNYHWLYSSTRDVPMTRPSIILPQSVYFDGTRDMSVGGDGIAYSTKYSDEGIGDLDFNISSTYASLSRDDTKIIVGQNSTGKLDHNKDIQASLYWQPAMIPIKLGVAMTHADFEYEQGGNDQFFDGDLSLERLYINAEYFGENWKVSTELLQENLDQEGVLFPLYSRDVTGQGGFAQFEYLFTQSIQALIRYERYYADKNDKEGKKLEESTMGLIPAYFGYQHDATIGFTYDFADNVKLQLEHHWFEGTARLTPLVFPDPIANPKEHWQLSAIQLTYWF